MRNSGYYSNTDKSELMSVTAAEFLTELRSIGSGNLITTCFPGPPDQNANWTGKVLNGSIPDVEHQNAFVTISKFIGGKRRKEEFTGLLAVFADDVGQKVEPDTLPVPTYIVQTSAGSQQWWYLLDKPVESPGDAEALINGVAEYTGIGDAKGLTRLGRIPGGINNKTKYSETYQVNAWNPNGDEIKRFSYKELIKLFPAHEIEESDWNIKEDQLVLFFRERELIKSELPGGKGYDITCPWVEEHTDQLDDGTALLKTPNGLGFKCHHGHHEDRTLKDVWNWVKSQKGYVEKAGKNAKTANNDPQFWGYVATEHKYFYLLNPKERVSVEAFNTMMPKVDVGGGDKPKFVAAHNAHDIKYTKFEWLPGQERDVVDNYGLKVLNTHMPYKKGSKGDVKLWREHIKRFYPYEAEIIENYLAFTIQHPRRKINYALFMVGKQGIGKNMMFNSMEWAMGSEFHCMDASNISSSYNDWLMGTKLLIIDEPRNNNDSRWHMAESLKTLLATSSDDQEMMINPKYGRQHTQKNLTNTIILSNHADSIRIKNERRFFACYSDIEKMDKEYYAALDAIDHGAVIHYLRNKDLRGFNPKQLPASTPSQQRIEDESRTEMVEDVADFIEEYGAVNFTQVMEVAKKHSKFIGEASVKRVIEEAGGKVEPRCNPDGKRIGRKCPKTHSNPDISESRVKLVCLEDMSFDEAWLKLKEHIKEHDDLPNIRWSESFC
jgi:hypothetical protein